MVMLLEEVKLIPRHDAVSVALARIIESGMDGRVIQDQRREDDRDELKDEVEEIELAALLRQVADKIETRVRRNHQRDMIENIDHDKADARFRAIIQLAQMAINDKTATAATIAAR